MICRILPHQSRSGVANMALDHALLDVVDAAPSSAVLRTYEWDEPTLSLGYFQHAAEADADPRWRGVPRVRRPSGGGALWHDREVTYALIVPRSHRLAARPSSLYRAVHAAIVELLVALDVPATRRGEDRTAESTRPFLCFLDRDPEDVMLGASKIVGIAKRRRPNALLQHGSVLLGCLVAVTPELARLCWSWRAVSTTPTSGASNRGGPPRRDPGLVPDFGQFTEGDISRRSGIGVEKTRFRLRKAATGRAAAGDGPCSTEETVSIFFGVAPMEHGRGGAVLCSKVRKEEKFDANNRNYCQGVFS